MPQWLMENTGTTLGTGRQTRQERKQRTHKGPEHSEESGVYDGVNHWVRFSCSGHRMTWESKKLYILVSATKALKGTPHLS